VLRARSTKAVADILTDLSCQNARIYFEEVQLPQGSVVQIGTEASNIDCSASVKVEVAR